MSAEKKPRFGVAAPRRDEGKNPGTVGDPEFLHPQHTTPGAGGQWEISGLLGCGAENAVPLRHLERITALPGREVRRIIEGERRRGVPVLSDNRRGYYLPGSREERAACVRSLRHRAEEILKTARAIEKAGAPEE